MDADRVYIYAGSYGVAAFRHDGSPAWSAVLPTVSLYNGSGASPILVDDLLVVNRGDTETGALIALDSRSGAVRWKTAYPRWGERVWWVKANTTGVSSPTTDGTRVFVATWNNFGEADQVPGLPPFADVVRQHDGNGDGFGDLDTDKSGTLSETEWTRSSPTGLATSPLAWSGPRPRPYRKCRHPSS